MAGHPHVRIARVLAEDDDFLTLEVAKSLDRELRVERGDRFLSVAFVHEDGGIMAIWLPWERA